MGLPMHNVDGPCLSMRSLSDGLQYMAVAASNLHAKSDFPVHRAGHRQDLELNVDVYLEECVGCESQNPPPERRNGHVHLAEMNCLSMLVKSEGSWPLAAMGIPHVWPLHSASKFAVDGTA